MRLGRNSFRIFWAEVWHSLCTCMIPVVRQGSPYDSIATAWSKRPDHGQNVRIIGATNALGCRWHRPSPASCPAMRVSGSQDSQTLWGRRQRKHDCDCTPQTYLCLFISAFPVGKSRGKAEKEAQLRFTWPGYKRKLITMDRIKTLLRDC